MERYHARSVLSLGTRRGRSEERPERYAESLRFETMPSRPILQVWAKTVGPSPSMCSFEPNVGAGLSHDRCECGLADLKRIAHIVAVQFDEVEGIEPRGNCGV